MSSRLKSAWQVLPALALSSTGLCRIECTPPGLLTRKSIRDAGNHERHVSFPPYRQYSCILKVTTHGCFSAGGPAATLPRIQPLHCSRGSFSCLLYSALLDREKLYLYARLGIAPLTLICKIQFCQAAGKHRAQVLQEECRRARHPGLLFGIDVHFDRLGSGKGVLADFGCGSQANRAAQCMAQQRRYHRWRLTLRLSAFEAQGPCILHAASSV